MTQKTTITTPHFAPMATFGTAFGQQPSALAAPVAPAASAVPSIPGDYAVPSPGNDGISSLSFSPTSNALVSTNWDGGVRVWDIQLSVTEQQASLSSPAGTSTTAGAFNALPKIHAVHSPNTAALCSTFSNDGSAIFTGGTDNAVRMINLNQAPAQGSEATQIGQHSAPVAAVGYCSETRLVVSGGWDGKLHFWDQRQPTPVGTLELPERCYDLDVRGNMMVVATAERHILVYNMTGAPTLHTQMLSPLKLQSRCIACFPDMTGFAVGSIEGRVGIQYVHKVAGKESFAFKCHRHSSDAYAVNDICFHQFGTFATVGADGVINFWDKDNKHRIQGFDRFNSQISCASFNAQGNIFAYASSYDWSEGAASYTPGQPNGIFLHYTPEDKIKPKNKKPGH